MLDGGLCWRIGKDKAERQAEDASRHLNPKHVDPEKQRKKDTALKMKRAALADPDLLTANVVLPGKLDALPRPLLQSHSCTLLHWAAKLAGWLFAQVCVTDLLYSSCCGFSN